LDQFKKFLSVCGLPIAVRIEFGYFLLKKIVANVWQNVFGKCLANIWQLFGKICLANAWHWHMFGKICFANFWQTFCH
jgi:hypothetical protein